MSVFRRRYVYRDSLETKLLGGASIVTASVTAAVVFAATISGSSPASVGTVSTPVVFSFGPISEITVEASVPLNTVFATTVSGVQRNLGAANANVVFGATPRPDALISANVVFNVTATVGSIFTQDVSTPVVFAVTATPANFTGATASPVVFSFSSSSGSISGGTVTPSTSSAVVFSLTGTGNAEQTISANVVFNCFPTGTRRTSYHTPPWRTCVIQRAHRRLV